MGRGAVGPASQFSQDIVNRVLKARDAAGFTTAELAKRSGLSRNYLYIRLRLDAPFNTNDLEALGRACGVDPRSFLGGGIADLDAPADVDADELSNRLQELTEARFDGMTPANEQELLAAVGLPRERWAAMLEGSDAPIERSTVVAIAAFFEVDDRFLLDAENARVSERVRARLELESALRRTGAQHFYARALGEVSPTAMRAITRAIAPIEAPQATY